MNSKKNIYLIIEGDIATNKILEQALAAGPYQIKKLISPTAKQILSITDGTLFFCRYFPPHQHWIPKLLKSNQIPYLFYLDDNFWELDQTTSLGRYYQSKKVQRSLQSFINESLYTITATIPLKKYIDSLIPSSKTVQIDAYFDFSLLEKVEPMIKMTHSNELKIGYAGTPKILEFNLIEPAIEFILNRYPNVFFELICDYKLNINHERIRYFSPILDYKKFLQKKISRKWDIGLAPLLENSFNIHKSNNKYREYGACKIPTVYSSVIPYKSTIKNNFTGILVNNTVDEWVKALSLLIENHQLRQEITNNAYQDIFNRYNLDNIKNQYFHYIDLAHFERNTRIKVTANYIKFLLIDYLSNTLYKNYLSNTLYKIRHVYLYRFKMYFGIYSFNPVKLWKYHTKK
jgi:glycosyltransferase involved in cell wall biosynthesis